MSDSTKVTDEEALAYHREPAPGKIEMTTQRDLSLAYDYTTKGNLVAVLFMRFADVNAIDIELDTEDPDEY